MSWTPLHGAISTGNTTVSPLAGTATFTGAAEQNNVPDVMASCFSDVAGTLYFDYSVNGTDWRTHPTEGFAITAGVNDFHVGRKGPRYFRARYINGIAAQTTFQLSVYYGWFNQDIIPVGHGIETTDDAIVTKSVISGIGNTTAKVTNTQSLQVTPPPEGKTAFGESAVAEVTPLIQLKFPHDFVHSNLIESRPNQSGTVSAANSMLAVSTGAAANSSGTTLTVEPVSYRAGQGFVTKFTTIYTAGVVNSTQIHGVGDSGEGFFFGYNGVNFGVMSRKGGNPEVRTLTITTASSTAENITITLDGDALATVAVTASGNTTTTANEIAAADYSDTGKGWKATAAGSTVIFTSWVSEVQTGTYSLSGATTAVGTFAQTLAGVVATDTWVAQANWNGADIFDGNGLSGVTLDPTKGNVYQIRFQYLGFGLITFYVEDPNDGEFHLIHSITYSNTNTAPSLDNPSLPICMSAINAANTSDLTVKSASMAVFIEGKFELTGPRRGVDASIVNATANEIPILTIRSAEVFQGGINRTATKILLTSVSAEHNKPVGIKFYFNATLTDASFSSIGSESTIEQDTSATAFSGGLFVFTIELGRTGNQIVDLTKNFLDGPIVPGGTLTATIAPTSGVNSEGTVSFYFVELL